MTSPALHWEVTAAPPAELGERPVWDASSGCLIWVDINAGQLHRLVPGGADEVIVSAGVPVGAAAPRTGGGYVLAAADGFRRIGPDGACGPAVRPAGMPANVRFNDGACDPAICGGMPVVRPEDSTASPTVIVRSLVGRNR